MYNNVNQELSITGISLVKWKWDIFLALSPFLREIILDNFMIC